MVAQGDATTSTLRPSVSQTSLQTRYSLSGHAPIRFPQSSSASGSSAMPTEAPRQRVQSSQIHRAEQPARIQRAVSTPGPRPSSKVLTSFPFPHPTAVQDTGDAATGGGATGTLKAGLRWLGLSAGADTQGDAPSPPTATPIAASTSTPHPTPRRTDSVDEYVSEGAQFSTPWHARWRRLAALPVRLLTRTDEDDEDRQERDEEEASEILEREALLYAQRRSAGTNSSSVGPNAATSSSTAASYGTLPLPSSHTNRTRSASIDSQPDPADPFGYRALAVDLDASGGLLPSHADYLAERRRARRARRLRRACHRALGIAVVIALITATTVLLVKGAHRWRGAVREEGNGEERDGSVRMDQIAKLNLHDPLMTTTLY